MNHKNSQQHIIVTGGSRGIGFGVAKAFLRHGAKVLLIARNDIELEEARLKLDELDGQIFIHPTDVSQASAVLRMAPIIERELEGRVDVLVNAAGIYGPIGKLEENDPELWKKTFEVNVFGTMLMCQLVIPFMKKAKWGRIITFSGGGDGAFPRFTAYSASKGAILRFTESLAAELREYNITVNAIAPGAVNTALLEEVLEAGEEKVGKEFYHKSLEQKAEGGISPDKAAELIVFLSSDACKDITGKMLSAVHDKTYVIEEHAEEIAKSDIYNVRRIKPQDRGYDWSKK